MTPTGGNWDPTAWPVYFVASNPETLGFARTVNDHMLVAVNELNGPEELEILDHLIGHGIKVFIDSGVFWLSTGHAKAHGMTMDQALGLPPEEVDGFAELFDKYVSLLDRIGDKVWGYIEIDQGGRANKIKTRARLEMRGLRPIPVYHPFNDGWDYFDDLARGYDRICFGNVVQADAPTRKRLIATAWERRRQYPDLWIHALGLTPGPLTAAWPINSCDSSAWLSPVRWGRLQAQAATRKCWDVGQGIIYDPAADFDAPRGHRKARTLAGYDAQFTTRVMKVMVEEAKHVLGADPALRSPA